MNRSLPVDLLRILLALMVLGIHAGLPAAAPEAVSYLLRHGVFRIAVPIFFIINGFYLAGALASKGAMVTWSRRLLMMYAFWMLVYLPFYLPGQVDARGLAVFASLLVFGYFHLWYIASLLMAGWILFLLREKNWRLLLAAAACCLLLGVALQYAVAYRGLHIPVWTYRGPLLLAFPMVTVGYLLKRVDLARYQGAAVVALVVGAGLLLAESWVGYVALSGLARFDMYLALMIVCPAAFVVANNLPGTLASDHPAKLSSAIYFCHPLCIWASREFFHTGSGAATGIVTLGLCLLIYYPLYLLSKRFRFIF